jgi:hypothetical protein
VLLGRRSFRARPWQHELGFVNRPGPGNDAIKGCRSEGDDRVPDPALDVGDRLAGVAFVPGPVEVLGELDDEVAREVLGPDLATLFLPETGQGFFLLAHDDAGVGAADEVAASKMKACC